MSLPNGVANSAANGVANDVANSTANGIPDAIEPDDRSIESDEFRTSEFNGTLISQFSSVSSSIYAHCYENGRRYHVYKYGRYPIPNDESEQGREEMTNVMFKELLDGRLYLAPIGENPQKILDLGTGTGAWAMEMGDMFPGAVVIGTDLSPIQEMWVPPNVRFIVEDMEDEWIHGSDFDLIHIRNTLCFIRNPSQLFGAALSNLQPGGFIEIQEIRPHLLCDDNTVLPDNALKRFYALLAVAMPHYGFQVEYGADLPTRLEEAGFINVQRVIRKLPFGPWPKSKLLRLLGYYFQLTLLDLIPALLSKVFSVLDMPLEDRDELLADLHDLANNTRIHGYVTVHFVWAQKPLY